MITLKLNLEQIALTEDDIIIVLQFQTKCVHMNTII